jgi:hypothetical protein
MLSVTYKPPMLSVTYKSLMLSVIMLNVVMLRVVAPFHFKTSLNNKLECFKRRSFCPLGGSDLTTFLGKAPGLTGNIRLGWKVVPGINPLA